MENFRQGFDSLNKGGDNHLDAKSLEEGVNKLDQDSQMHGQVMTQLKQDAALSKEMQMAELMRQLNGGDEFSSFGKEYSSLSPKVVPVSRIRDNFPYTSDSVISHVSTHAKRGGYTDMKLTDIKTDASGAILSVGSRGKNSQGESVGTCFYRGCSCADFSSKETCIVNEYYENGQVVWADAPISLK